jgi:hypothetical protein
VDLHWTSSRVVVLVLYLADLVGEAVGLHEPLREPKRSLLSNSRHIVPAPGMSSTPL